MDSKFKRGDIVTVKFGHYKGLTFKIQYAPFSVIKSEKIMYIKYNKKMYEHSFEEKELRKANKKELKEYLIDEL
ncbi:hypothetical protein KY343_05715 [Candidatus Woesearchaeota archaeon]|nr:hypothetical protein [Candidatus Woesearchaeota archaeon]